MASATKAAAAKGGTGVALLKGSNIPKGKRNIMVHCIEVREAPEEWKTALIMDIVPVYECGAFPLNQTNIKTIVEHLGDDYDDWAGHTFALEKIKVRNPSTGKPADSLAVVTCSKKPVKLPKMAKAEDDVPF